MAGKDDPIEKLRNLIREEISGSDKARERRELEAKDPWEKLRGMIRDEVSAAFDALGAGADEGKRKEGKRGGKDDDDDEKPKLGILGM